MKQKLMFVLAIIMACSSAIYAADGYKAEKDYAKTVGVSDGDRFRIVNSFGSISVSYWKKKEISIRVNIVVESSSKEYVDAQIAAISVSTSKKDGLIESWSEHGGKVKFHGKGYNRFSIDYVVCVPEGMKCELVQEFGNITLPVENSGEYTLRVKYGDVSGGRFSGRLDAHVKYGSFDFDYAANAKIKVEYGSKNALRGGGDIDLHSMYSTVTLGRIKHLGLRDGYGKITVEAVDDADMSMRFSNCNIGHMSHTLQCSNLEYTNLTASLAAGFSDVAVKSKFGNMVFVLPASASFRLKTSDLEFGSCKINGFKNIARADNFDDGFDSRKSRHRGNNMTVNGGRGGMILVDSDKFSNVQVRAD